jgi:hypothetical protein
MGCCEVCDFGAQQPLLGRALLASAVADVLCWQAGGGLLWNCVVWCNRALNERFDVRGHCISRLLVHVQHYSLHATGRVVKA